jgi:hypothetical protein
VDPSLFTSLTANPFIFRTPARGPFLPVPRHTPTTFLFHPGPLHLYSIWTPTKYLLAHLELQGHAIKNQDLLIASGTISLTGSEGMTAVDEDVAAAVRHLIPAIACIVLMSVLSLSSLYFTS